MEERPLEAVVAIVQSARSCHQPFHEVCLIGGLPRKLMAPAFALLLMPLPDQPVQLREAGAVEGIMLYGDPMVAQLPQREPPRPADTQDCINRLPKLQLNRLMQQDPGRQRLIHQPGPHPLVDDHELVALVAMDMHCLAAGELTSRPMDCADRCAIAALGSHHWPNANISHQVLGCNV